jgi:hypothetical protein
MPVSKKRKKDGKPVHRKAAGPEHEEGQHPAAAPDAAPPAAVTPGRLVGKPTNPFVAQQSRRASQRGR